jgi:hypothetical protein
MMSDCFGDTPNTAKTDREMSDFLSHRANEVGVSKSELLRRLFDHYRESRDGELDCPHCGENVTIKL